MKKRHYSIILIIVVITLFALIENKANATIHTITVQNNFFSPSSINVLVGDTVHFQWVEGNHTTTCDPGTLPGTSYPAGFFGWDAVMNSGNTDYYVAITQPGAYVYGCQPHWPAMQGTITATTGYKYWIGINGGGDGASWTDAFNWLDGTVPSTTDSVLLNNSFVTSTYFVNLPGGTARTQVAKIVIQPTLPNSIYFVLPSTNTIDSSLRLGNGSGSPYDFVIGKNGIFWYKTGATSGLPFVLLNTTDSIQILDGGLWWHNCRVGQTGIANKLSKRPETKYGTFRYDMTTLSFASIQFQNITYGNLELSGYSAAGGVYMAKKYITTGSSACNVRGNFYMDEYCYDSTTMLNNLNIGGNFTMYGKIVYSGNSTRNINFNGTSLQTIECGGLSAINYQISRSVSFNNAAGFNITTPFYVDSVTMTNGNIATAGGAWLGVGYDATNKGYLNRIGGIVTGQMERWYLAGAISDPLIFPVGTSTVLKQATVKFSTAPTTAGRIGVKFIDNGTGGSDLPVTLNDAGFPVTRRSNSYWQMTGTWLTGGLIDVDLDGNGQEGITNSANLRVVWSNDGGTTFSLQGVHKNGTLNTGKRGDVGYYFSDFYIAAGADNPLPVQLASFNSTVNDRSVSLRWTTASEQNNAYFNIERKNSADENWNTIGKVNGAGNSGTIRNYTFTDKGNNTGRFNYRLKQVDFNGNTEYHNLANEVIIGVPSKYDIGQNYPNPFNPTTKVDFQLPVDSKVSILVYDMTGRELKTLLNNELRTAGYYTAEFNGSSFASGTYFYRFITEAGGKQNIITKKMVLIK